jgi:hypothetical protein
VPHLEYPEMKHPHMVSSRTFDYRSLFTGVLLCLAALLLSPLAYGQTNERTQSRTGEVRENRTDGLSDLAQDNLSRVAASSDQIRTVLVKDTGLLVELKRWVAKEATENGQVVDDSTLSDQAIFDRLDRDVAFRSIATRLVQRYGYLLPAPNPDSSFAKEEDYVLKERARHLVQVEAQEDSGSIKNQQSQNQELERTSACDPQQDTNCEKTDAGAAQSRRQLENGPSAPEHGTRSSPETPDTLTPDNSLRTLRSSLSDGGLGRSDTLFGPQIQLAAGLEKQRVEGSVIPPTPNFSASDELSALNLPSYATGSPETSARNDVPSASARSNWMRPSALEGDADVASVKMVHPANPYADIPSLYDMYVQAAGWQRPAQRFGLDVFRNMTSQPDVIPMDLPVGPDYVVGTGDSLSIDLWGSVTQRLVRLVDREGRIALPETGPVLVTGKSLSDVQMEVQHALRSAFRDVSADVSLSRLRTVRV